MKGSKNQPASPGGVILETVIALGCQAAVVYLAYLDLMQYGFEQASYATILTLIEIVLFAVWLLYKAMRRKRRQR